MNIAAIIVMGVSGSGKSTIGALLAARLGWRFEDGDDFHPPANVAKMRAGTPLADEDRRPWLAAIAARLGRARAAGQGVVIGCSALKRAYRDALRDGHADLRFLHLAGPIGLIAARQAARQGHFMPPSLMASQYEALEPPDGEPDALTIPVDAPPDRLAEAALHRLAGSGLIPGFGP